MTTKVKDESEQKTSSMYVNNAIFYYDKITSLFSILMVMIQVKTVMIAHNLMK